MNKAINIEYDKKPKWLCSWNGGEIVQIHTRETLYGEYKETLFDVELVDYLGSIYQSGIDKQYKTVDQYLDDCEKYNGDFINIPFGCDNMTIIQIM